MGWVVALPVLLALLLLLPHGENALGFWPAVGATLKRLGKLIIESVKWLGRFIGGSLKWPIGQKWLKFINESSLGLMLVIPTCVLFILAFNIPKYAVMGGCMLVFVFNVFGLLMAFIIPFKNNKEIRSLFEGGGCLYYITSLTCDFLLVPYGNKLRYARDITWRRYDIENKKDGALSYAHSASDRIINKAGWLLAFNSILMTLNTFQSAQPIMQEVQCWPWRFAREYAVIIGLTISSILLLELLYVKWIHGDWLALSNKELFDLPDELPALPDELPAIDSYRREFTQTIVRCRDWSIIVNSSIVISIFCLIAIIVNTISLAQK